MALPLTLQSPQVWDPGELSAKICSVNEPRRASEGIHEVMVTLTQMNFAIDRALPDT